jgi:regulator of sigma E protease
MILKILTVLEVLLLFNLLIGVHELGHFLAAKWRGLKIDRFAIWFGKPLWKKNIDGVEYALGWIPAGGYVALPQMATMEVIEGKGESSGKPLPPISPLDKTIVAFAGPLFSFLLALAFAVVVWQVGKPEPNAKNSTTIGWVQSGGPAALAGLRPGDKILAVDDHPVTQFLPPSPDSVTWRIVTSENTNIAIKYQRDGKEGIAYANPTNLPTKWYERKSLRKILISQEYPAVIAVVVTNSPAAAAGLLTNDEVVAIDGQPIFSPEAVVSLTDALTNGPLKPSRFTIRRDGKQFDCTLQAETPIKPAKAPASFGFFVWEGPTDEVLQHPTPFDQIRAAAGQIFATVNTVMSRKSDVGIQQLAGPVMILRVYGTLLSSDNGWRRVLWFSVVLNVNLAMLNLLPFPVLDGGHILLAILEAIRRSPVSAKLLQSLQTTCAVVLIAFMLFIMWHDIGDWIGDHIRNSQATTEEPIVFAPKTH